MEERGTPSRLPLLFVGVPRVIGPSERFACATLASLVMEVGSDLFSLVLMAPPPPPPPLGCNARGGLAWLTRASPGAADVASVMRNVSRGDDASRSDDDITRTWGDPTPHSATSAPTSEGVGDADADDMDASINDTFVALVFQAS